jgi:hypothetical protein
VTSPPSNRRWTSLCLATRCVHEKPTPYVEKLVLPRSGAPGAYVTLEVWPGEHPVVDGTGVSGDDLLLIAGRSWVRVVGLELRNDLGLNDGAGIRVTGAGSHVELRQNRIHDIRGRNAMGITVYGTEAAAISDLVIDGNEIFDCDPAPSEALTLNGNVDGFQVTNNVVRDVNNIAIDLIGGERDIQPDQNLVARNGVVRGNQVMRARSSYGGGFAGGIYVDGGRAIVVENNLVTESDLGLEVGAENSGIVASSVTVRNNLLIANEKAGLMFGGYAAGVGAAQNRHSTLTVGTTLARSPERFSGTSAFADSSAVSRKRQRRPTEASTASLRSIWKKNGTRIGSAGALSSWRPRKTMGTARRSTTEIVPPSAHRTAERSTSLASSSMPAFASSSTRLPSRREAITPGSTRVVPVPWKLSAFPVGRLRPRPSATSTGAPRCTMYFARRSRSPTPALSAENSRAGRARLRRA